ncbi:MULTISPECIES: ABC transporter permease [unclassified Caballeronia]|uniref:ABC transporter permease n=1 Tax=unclassified Caballeronia TaxID=2646786 RepID=UPI001F34BBD7|nr:MULTISPECIES: ABC transporter permease [unclassified Caballeronia]MCE4547025.1 ABC transporter permease [Caballeronia sp. PC1]MCE4572502.1 ABC transporter permease [Caballeronia sp. CLC5]
MSAYLLRRIGSALLTVWLMSVLIFVLVRMVGDPAYLLMPPEATEADRQIFREQLGLADPVPLQYARFLAGLLRGDMGNSFHFGAPALSMALSRLASSLLLVGVSLTLALAIGLSLGVVSAVRRGGWIDRLTSIFAVLGQAAPPFFVALLLIRLFSVQWGWLPTGGHGSWRHLILPVCALAWYSAAGIARLTRANLLMVLEADYIRMARIKGLPERVVVGTHALRNTALPIVAFTASQFGVLIGGAVAIETVFSWPGFGSLMVEAISTLDFTVVQAAVIVSVLLFVSINLAVDVLYALVGPRIRYRQ